MQVELVGGALDGERREVPQIARFLIFSSLDHFTKLGIPVYRLYEYEIHHRIGEVYQYRIRRSELREAQAVL